MNEMEFNQLYIAASVNLHFGLAFSKHLHILNICSQTGDIKVNEALM